MAPSSQHGTPADPVDGDTIEVKGEPNDATELDEKMQSIKVEGKQEPSGSGSSSPSFSPSKPKISRTPSSVSIKSSDTTENLTQKKEEVVGGEITVKMEPGQPTKLARSTSQKVTSRPPPLFDHSPDATDEAKSSFMVMESCTYSNKYLGYTEHAMECDCNEEWDPVAGKNHACGDDSDCINRATKMECVGDCGCGPACQNQRFQQREFAKVSVIQTEKKGYGLRTDVDLRPNDFIFEYIGEVINEPQFRRRMLQYDEQGIKHFYFMSLSKGEFVDATKRGNLGRFCNHSCNPNCYVDKWVVGDKLRMGIFAERKIKAGEELVFNYNVDRYGANPQPCYCGEPNCTGFIGGKTQTERATKLSHATIEALGIEDGDGWDTAVAKKPRKKKVGEDDEEYVDSVQPKSLDADAVTKVMAALMQCKEKWIAVKLLSRIQRCEDEQVRNRVVKMHGYQILNSQLAAWKEDVNVVLQILDILDKFPRLTRNKIVDSKIETTLQPFTSNEDERVRDQSTRLLGEWSKLEVAYRIPRKKRDPKETSTPTKPERNTFERRESSMQERKRSKSRSRSRSRSPPRGPAAIPSGPRSTLPQRNNLPPRGPPFRRPFNPLPKGWFEATAEGKTYYYSASGQTQWTRPNIPANEPPPPPKQPSNQDVLKSIIDNIVTAKEKQREVKTTTPDTPRAAPKKEKKEKKEEKWKSYDEEKKKKLYENTLFPHISHVMNKYKAKLPREDLKRFAKEIAKKLVNSDFKSGRVDNPTKISDKHEKKVKKFCKDFFDKAVYKHNAHEKKRAEKTKPDANGKLDGKQPPPTPDTALDLSPDAKKDEDDTTMLSDVEDDVKMSDDEDGDADLDKTSSPTSPDTLKRKREAGDNDEETSAENGVFATPASPSKRLRSQSIDPSTSDVVPPPPAPPPPPPMTPDDTQQDDVVEENGLTHDHEDEGTAFAGKSMADVLASAQQDAEDDVDALMEVETNAGVAVGPNPLSVNGDGRGRELD